jgi:ketosteroid isomerase-like protein
MEDAAFRDKLEVVRKAFEAFERRDPSQIAEVASADIVFHAPTWTFAGRTSAYQGHDGLLTYLADVDAVWEELRVSPREFRRVGECVVALGTVSGRLRGGDRVETEVAWAWRVPDGKVVWGRVYERPDDALNDAALHRSL